MEKQTTITIRNAPPGLRRRVKIAAAEQGITAQAMLVDLIEEYLSQRDREKKGES